MPSPLRIGSWPETETSWDYLFRLAKKHDNLYDKLKSVFPFQKSEGRGRAVQQSLNTCPSMKQVCMCTLANTFWL